MTVFQRDPLLKGAIRKNELSGKIDIVGDLGWERTSFSLTDTSMCTSFIGIWKSSMD